MAQIGETLQELKQAVDNNEILPESGQEKIIQKTMSLWEMDSMERRDGRIRQR